MDHVPRREEDLEPNISAIATKVGQVQIAKLGFRVQYQNYQDLEMHQRLMRVVSPLKLGTLVQQERHWSDPLRGSVIVKTASGWAMHPSAPTLMTVQMVEVTKPVA
jgi:hypothetical protein